MTDDTSMASTLTFSQVQTLCQIFPLVPATILHYSIRNTEGPIAGMLLGVREGNIVSIRNCYPVLIGFTEDKEGGKKDSTVITPFLPDLGCYRHGILQQDVQALQ